MDSGAIEIATQLQRGVASQFSGFLLPFTNVLNRCSGRSSLSTLVQRTPNGRCVVLVTGRAGSGVTSLINSLLKTRIDIIRDDDDAITGGGSSFSARGLCVFALTRNNTIANSSVSIREYSNEENPILKSRVLDILSVPLAQKIVELSNNGNYVVGPDPRIYFIASDLATNFNNEMHEFAIMTIPGYSERSLEALKGYAEALLAITEFSDSILFTFPAHFALSAQSKNDYLPQIIDRNVNTPQLGLSLLTATKKDSHDINVYGKAQGHTKKIKAGLQKKNEGNNKNDNCMENSKRVLKQSKRFENTEVGLRTGVGKDMNSVPYLAPCETTRGVIDSLINQNDGLDWVDKLINRIKICKMESGQSELMEFDNSSSISATQIEDINSGIPCLFEGDNDTDEAYKSKVLFVMTKIDTLENSTDCIRALRNAVVYLTRGRIVWPLEVQKEFRTGDGSILGGTIAAGNGQGILSSTVLFRSCTNANTTVSKSVKFDLGSLEEQQSDTDDEEPNSADLSNTRKLIGALESSQTEIGYQLCRLLLNERYLLQASIFEDEIPDPEMIPPEPGIDDESAAVDLENTARLASLTFSHLSGSSSESSTSNNNTGNERDNESENSSSVNSDDSSSDHEKIKKTPTSFNDSEMKESAMGSTLVIPKKSSVSHSAALSTIDDEIKSTTANRNKDISSTKPEALTDTISCILNNSNYNTSKSSGLKTIAHSSSKGIGTNSAILRSAGGHRQKPTVFLSQQSGGGAMSGIINTDNISMGGTIGNDSNNKQSMLQISSVGSILTQQNQIKKILYKQMIATSQVSIKHYLLLMKCLANALNAVEKRNSGIKYRNCINTTRITISVFGLLIAFVTFVLLLISKTCFSSDTVEAFGAMSSLSIYMCDYFTSNASLIPETSMKRIADILMMKYIFIFGDVTQRHHYIEIPIFDILAVTIATISLIVVVTSCRKREKKIMTRTELKQMHMVFDALSKNSETLEKQKNNLNYTCNLAYTKSAYN